MLTPDNLRDESIGELFGRLGSDLTLLVRQELELFRAEMTEKASRAGAGAGMLSGAAVAGLFALACLTATIVILLAAVMPAWVAALVVTVAYGVAAAVLAVAGKRKIEDVVTPVPEQTVQTVKEDIAWAKTQTNSVKR